MLRIGTTCETVQIWTACELTDRDDERYGADLDGVCEWLRIDDLRAEREVVRYELTTTYERDALRAGLRTNEGSTSVICADLGLLYGFFPLFGVYPKSLSVFARARR